MHQHSPPTSFVAPTNIRVHHWHPPRPTFPHHSPSRASSHAPHQPPPSALPTRRSFLRVLSAAAAAAATLPLSESARAAQPVRTLLDEERERAASLSASRQSELDDALRRGFDAVAAAAGRLDELAETARAEGGLETVSGVAVRFNNEVVREGMGKIGKGFGGEGRKNVERICRKVTDGLVAVSKSARGGDLQATLDGIDRVRGTMREFQALRP